MGVELQARHVLVPRRMRLLVPVLGTTLALSSIAPSMVRADSDAGVCESRVLPLAGPIPANQPAIVVHWYLTDPEALAFVRIADDGTESPVAADVTDTSFPLSRTYVPTAPLVVGGHYRAYVGGCDGSARRAIDYTVVEPLEEIDLGLSLSALERAHRDVPPLVSYSLEATLELDEVLAAYLSVFELDWTIETSGGTEALHPGGRPRERRRIDVECPGSTTETGTFPEGALTVSVAATSDFAPTVTDEASTTTVCASAIDVPISDLPQPDAGIDAGVSAALDAGPGVPPSSGCSATPANRSGAVWLAALSLLTAHLLRRRR